MLNINSSTDLENLHNSICEKESFQKTFPQIRLDQQLLQTKRFNFPECAYHHCINHCSALKKLYNKSQMEQLSHWEGFSLIWFSLHFQNFEKVISQMKGWGDSHKDRRQILNSMEKNYQPMSCNEMIQRGLCDKKSPCFIYGGELRGSFFKPNPILFVNGAKDE